MAVGMLEVVFGGAALAGLIAGPLIGLLLRKNIEPQLQDASASRFIRVGILLSLVIMGVATITGSFLNYYFFPSPFGSSFSLDAFSISANVLLLSIPAVVGGAISGSVVRRLFAINDVGARRLIITSTSVVEACVVLLLITNFSTFKRGLTPAPANSDQLRKFGLVSVPSGYIAQRFDNNGNSFYLEIVPARNNESQTEFILTSDANRVYMGGRQARGSTDSGEVHYGV